MCDLITLAYAKEYMRISSSDNDALISQIIDAVSSQIERHCDRHFCEKTYRVWLDGTGCDAMRLPQYPISRLYRVATNRECVGNITYNGAGGVATASFSTSDRVLALAEVTTSGTELFVDVTSSGRTLQNFSTQLPAVWNMTIQNLSKNGKLPASDIRPFSDWSDQSADDIDIEVPCEAINARPQAWTEDTIETVDNSGFYNLGSGFPKGRSNVFVWYRAGYATIPAGLQQITARIVKEVFDVTAVDTGKDSEKIGDYSYKNASPSASGITGATSQSVVAHEMELSAWCRKSL